ncbi:MAG: UMP kinase, partial [Candidatus Nanohalobium sp.]
DTPKTAEEIRKAASTGQNVVMGGLTPGHSTDAVAAIAAEILESDLYIATTVDGVYDKDPGEEGAEKFEDISTEELRTVVSGNNEAGGHELIDLTAIDIIERSGTETKIFEGTLENIEKPEEASGTEIKPSA